jgi:hypothetical protein
MLKVNENKKAQPLKIVLLQGWSFIYDTSPHVLIVSKLILAHCNGVLS